jgi:PAS domain S-box-containing protein
MRVRQVTPVALVLAATIAGSFGAHLIEERDALRNSERSAEVAAAQIRDRVEEGSSLTESVAQYVSTTDVTIQAFEINALQWLSPAGLPAAGWVEQVPASGRAAYERRTGQPIVTFGRLLGILPAGARSSYLPATLVSGIAPMNVPGLDLGSDPGFAAALARASASDSEAATPLATLPDGAEGLFLIRPAPRLTASAVQPGFVVLFESAAWLRAAATNAPMLRITTGYGPSQELGGTATVGRTFSAAGQQFDVVVPKESVRGTAAAAPWIILAMGLVLAAFAAALGANATRRARAQDELDRIFSLSPDLITVADFAGNFTRVNPAAERILGYTQEELIAHPFLDFVHPDDRVTTAREAAAIAQGKTTLSFENRYVCKDGSYRVLEWTSTPVVRDSAMYAFARDVTERRQAEIEVLRLADEQAALRRVATLVAGGAPPAGVFDAVVGEMESLLPAGGVMLLRYESADEVTVLAHRARGGEVIPPGTRASHVDGESATGTVWRTRRPARHVHVDGAPGGLAAIAHKIGFRAVVAAPVIVDGRLWGCVVANWVGESVPPPDSEERMANFAELLGTAIANADSREALRRLADQQAALRRVATLVALEASQAEVFAAIAEEVRRLLDADEIWMLRYERDTEAVVVATTGRHPDVFPVGSRWPLGGENVTSRVLRTGRPARVADYGKASGRIAEAARSTRLRALVGTPILVRGQLWGTILTGTFADDPLPPDTESRLGEFTELMAIAIANTEARGEVRRLAAEQAALRRVATLVAEGASPSAILDAVAAETERALGADGAVLFRYEPDEEVTVVAQVMSPRGMAPGTRISHKGRNVCSMVRRSGRPARIGDYKQAQGPLADAARAAALSAAVGAPIIVDGRLWGVIVATWRAEGSPPGETEERTAQFAQLVATAIGNADSRDQLTASRARLVTEADEARRRVVRDLHDGAQQRLLQTIVTLGLAQRALEPNSGKTQALIAEALAHARQGNSELRELARGILPAVLIQGGLRSGVSSIVSRLDLPVEVEVPRERFAADVEASAYFVVAEALTNVVKHSHAEHAEVRACVEDGMLRVEVRDDGVGGADRSGHGLVGLGDRVAAIGGQLVVESPESGGTLLAALLPVAAG